MLARRLAAELREIKRIEEERIRQERLEQERMVREKEAADEQSIEDSLKYVFFKLASFYPVHTTTSFILSCQPWNSKHKHIFLFFWSKYELYVYAFCMLSLPKKVRFEKGVT